MYTLFNANLMNALGLKQLLKGLNLNNKNLYLNSSPEVYKVQ